jgi:hypothetical protein
MMMPMTLRTNSVSAVLIPADSSRAATAITQNENNAPIIQTNAPIDLSSVLLFGVGV